MSFSDEAPAADPPRFWRSLEERAGSPEFLAVVSREFPVDASLWTDGTSRRTFLQRMAASLALAGFAGCARQPDETIVPYVDQPDNIVPGRPQVFATTIPEPGGAVGVLVTSHTGRPTMIAGNSRHPASLGSPGLFAQASLLELYDPDRSQVARRGSRISSWSAFATELTKRLESLRKREGKGLALVTGRITSPTLLDQIGRLLEALPQASWHVHEPVSDDNARRGSVLAFGRPLLPKYRLESARVIASFDSDFLSEGPARLRLAREFSSRRRIQGTESDIIRLYVAESSPTLTGARADHRVPLSPPRVSQALIELARRLRVDLQKSLQVTADLDELQSRWVEAMSADLQAAGTSGLVLVGESLPPAMHALGHAINDRLGSLGSVTLREPFDQPAVRAPAPLVDLVKKMARGEVETLVLLGTNPVYTAAADLRFAEKLEKVPFSVHHGVYADETAVRCTWHLPLAHVLESWGDSRSEDGTASLIQPLIAPLYGAHSACDLLNLLLGDTALTDVETLRAFWKRRRAEDSEEQFQAFWKESLHEGIIAGSAEEGVEASLLAEWGNGAPAESAPAASSGESFSLVVRPDPHLLDGRFANNGWLQELPRPLTKLTWGNAAWISPQDAARFELKNGDLVDLDNENGAVRIPVWLMPGQPDGVVTVHRGYGRTAAGRVGNGIGVDVAPLLRSSSAHALSVRLSKIGRNTPLATTQTHQSMEGDPLVRTGTLEKYRAAPDHPEFMWGGSHADNQRPVPTLYPEWPKHGPQWGMAIDLATCIGCSACTLACQAENNIPIVGAEQVKNGREMHWIRVDTYFSGETENPSTHHQPVPCMHCEHAPCEVVCPVAATTHSHDGLNEMTYNRCIGTRYCSNNCPYKVRRFNFLDYRAEARSLPVLQLGQNPEVTVRSRGVMEKCTYCVQRIWNARIQSKLEERNLRDGDVVTACQAACPTEAIVFGDVSDPTSRVSKIKASSLNYSLLEQLNTRPRTTYLADVRNPNPEMPTEAKPAAEGNS